ncbi:MAG: glutathione peroxidase [Sulfurospirillum sp.]|nr:glutathione peroxidase [Sulfurospirillum sp.]MBP9613596.1 glutathione peroxidase [Sulfurospirillum sp.]
MSLYDFELMTIDKEKTTLAPYKGKVLLIVNVASKCGFTYQYEGLEKLYKTYKDKGLVILGFPSNQFSNQEPGNEEEIKNFCSLTYDVTFPMFSKIDVNGENAHPLYVYLKKEQSGILGSESIKWNFTKFLVDKQGNVIERFAPTTAPESLEETIKGLL